MKFGICLDFKATDRLKAAKDAGFDYVELNFSALSRANDADIDALKRTLAELELPATNANGFIPGDLPIIGTDFCRGEMISFIETGMRRCRELGINTVVFGSGGARALPESYNFSAGINELAAFLRNAAAPIAEKHNVTIVIEPLCRPECNVIHTLDEGAILAAMANYSNVAVLADLYHMTQIGDGCAEVLKLSGLIKHAHVAEPEKRVFPREGDEYDYSWFINVLERSGCSTCSVEAHFSDFAAEADAAAKVLSASKELTG